MKNQINEKEWADYLTGVLKGLMIGRSHCPTNCPKMRVRYAPLIDDDARESLGVLLGYFTG